jgi:hypothetical protein
MLLTLTTYLGCQVFQTNQQLNQPACKDYNLNVPIITVDAETNGAKSGDTHFYSHSAKSEVVYSYENFANEQEAEIQFEEQYNKKVRDHSSKIKDMNERVIKDSNGEKIGQKVGFNLENEKFGLIWLNKSKLNYAESTSRAAIEEIERSCNF